MTSTVSNYDRRRSLRERVPLLLMALAPLSLVGFTVKPALDFQGLGSELSVARERAGRAAELHRFLQGFGTAGPPTFRYRAIEASLVERIPEGFEMTDFYEAALAATQGLSFELASIVPAESFPLELPLGHQELHQRRVVLKGTGRFSHLMSFLAGLHRVGHPVSVLECSVFSRVGDPQNFDYKLELGAFYRAERVKEDDVSDV